MSIDPNMVLMAVAIIGPTITSVLAFVSSKSNATKIAAASDKVDNLHNQLNSRLTELIAVVRAQSHAEGVIEGRQQVKSEVKNST